jgi:hypothetical protein
VQHDKYLASDQWKAARAPALARDDYHCVACGTAGRLHVHHMTYERFTREELADLVTLCEQCHSLIHERYDKHKAGHGKRTLQAITKTHIRSVRGHLPGWLLSPEEKAVIAAREARKQKRPDATGAAVAQKKPQKKLKRSGTDWREEMHNHPTWAKNVRQQSLKRQENYLNGT